MRKIIGSVFQSLDGVMQAPGGPNEDWTGGFSKGGWLAPIDDDAVGDAIGKLFAPPFDLLLGRRTYDIFAAYWPYAQGNTKPMGEMFDRVGKYVLTHRDEGLDWQNSHRLRSLDSVAQLKQSDGPDLVIQGSSMLFPLLLAAGLLDRLTLMTFPLVLGRGKRLFGEGTPPAAMKMVDHQVSPGGSIIATYEVAGEVEVGSFITEPPSQREHERQEQMKREEGVA